MEREVKNNCQFCETKKTKIRKPRPLGYYHSPDEIKTLVEEFAKNENKINDISKRALRFLCKRFSWLSGFEKFCEEMVFETWIKVLAYERRIPKNENFISCFCMHAFSVARNNLKKLNREKKREKEFGYLDKLERDERQDFRYRGGDPAENEFANDSFFNNH